MSLQKYVRQLRPIQEKYVAPVVKVQNFISEDIDLPSDVLDGTLCDGE